MSFFELLLIMMLCIILLKPNDIELIVKSIGTMLIKANKYINEIKKTLFHL